MAVVGRASILVTPSFNGFQQAVAKQMPKQGQQAGQALGSNIISRLRKAAAPLAVGAILGTALKKGFSRLSGIEQAQAKLRGLGHDAQAVEGIMKDALASVKGTAFGMDEAATTAAGAVAAGIKPGKELEKYLKLTADAATIAGTSMGEMGSIINKTTTSGKVYSDNLNQLADRGIPIFQWLAAEYKVSAEELSTMVRKGQVDSETFRKVIEENIGGAALESGNTTSGAFKNMGAALGRVGANLLEGVFPMFQKVFSGIINALEPVEGVAKNLGATLGRYVVGAFESLQAAWPAIKAGLIALKDAAAPIIPALRDIGAALVPLIPNLSGTAQGFSLLKGAVSLVSSILSGVATFARENGTAFRLLVGTVLAGVVAFKAYQKVMAVQKAVMATYRAVQAGVTLGTYGLTGATYAQGAAQKVGAVASGLYNTALGLLSKGTRKATIEQLKLNFAFLANPIGIIVVAVGALVAGILYLWNTNEGFRNFVIGAWEKIKAAFSAVVDWFSGSVLPIFQKVFGGIQAGVQAVIGFVQKNWGWLKFIILGPIIGIVTEVVKHWDSIKAAFAAAWEWVSGKFAAWWAGMKAIFGPPLDVVRKIIEVFVAAGILVFKTLWGWISGFFARTWRGLVRIFKPPIDAVVTFIKDWVTGTIANFTRVWQWISGTFKTWWNNLTSMLSGPINTAKRAIGIAWDAIKLAFSTVWGWVKGTFTTGWNGLKSILSTPINLARDAIGKALDKIKTAFTKTREAISKAWAKIKDAMGKPVKWVADKVVNPLIGAFNKVAVAVGLEQNQLDLWEFKGFDQGGWTGPGPKMKVAGVVHADEFVVSKDARNQFEKKFPGYLHHINRTGSLPGYDKGGQVKPVPGFGNRHASGYPWASWAGDYPNPTGTPVGAWKNGIVSAVRHLTTSYGKHVRMNHGDGTSSLYAHLSRILVGVGQQLKAGQRLGLVGSTGNSTGPHLHFEAIGGPYSPGKAVGGDFTKDAGGGFKDLFSGFPNPIAWLRDLIAKPLAKVKDIAGGPFGQMVGKLPGMMADGMRAKIKDAFNLFGANPGGSGVARWTDTVKQALGMVGLPGNDSYVNAWLKQIKSESGGDPNIAQKIHDVNGTGEAAGVGLVQVIPGTFAAYRSKSLPDDRRNPLANLFAGMNYAKNRYGIANMLNVIGHGHGYDSGGYLQPGYTLAFNGTNKPEPVFTNQQWDLLAHRGTSSDGLTVNGGIHGYTAAEVAAEIELQRRRREALRVRV